MIFNYRYIGKIGSGIEDYLMNQLKIELKKDPEVTVETALDSVWKDLVLKMDSNNGDSIRGAVCAAKDLKFVIEKNGLDGKYLKEYFNSQ